MLNTVIGRKKGCFTTHFHLPTRHKHLRLLQIRGKVLVEKNVDQLQKHQRPTILSPFVCTRHHSWTAREREHKVTQRNKFLLQVVIRCFAFLRFLLTTKLKSLSEYSLWIELIRIYVCRFLSISKVLYLHYTLRSLLLLHNTHEKAKPINFIRWSGRSFIFWFVNHNENGK